MIKTLTNLLKQDKEKFVVPKGVQDCIPITAIYDDGIFRVGKDKYSKSFKFTDINYAVASREDKEAMFLEYSELLNSLDSGATTNYSTNYQISGRELLTPDEVRMLDNQYAILFIRGERPVMDFKYDILKHPNVALTTDGKALFLR